MEALRQQLTNSTDDKEKAEIMEKILNLIDEKKQKTKAYRQTEAGKAALKRANAKYWAKKRSGRPRGRPKKNPEK